MLICVEIFLPENPKLPGSCLYILHKIPCFRHLTLILLFHTSYILAFQRLHHTQGTASFSSNDNEFSSSIYTFSSSTSSKKNDMEDRNILAADCIIISCCCQCMILQILIFLLLKLPQKLLRKAKQYVKKLRTRKKGTKIMQIEVVGYDEDSLRSHGNSPFRIEVEEFFPDGTLRLGCGCMDEVEQVLVDFSNKGEFCFGSFWGGDQGSRRLSWCLKQEEIDHDNFSSHLIEVFGSSTSLGIHTL